MTSSLLHVEKESLEVLAFRVVDVDGVVSGLVQTIEDTDAAAGLGGGGEHGEGKALLVNDLRAAEREDQASGSDLGDRGGVQTLIGTEGVVQGTSMLGECRRIHDHQIVLVLWDVAQELDGIGAIACVSGWLETVQEHIPFYHIDGLAGAVHGINVNCAGAEGIDREASGVAEEVQDVAASGIFPDKGPVLPLVEEEAGLLAFGPVDKEFMAVLKDDLLVIGEALGAVKVAVNKVEAGLERGGAGAFVIDCLQGRAIDGFQGLADRAFRTEHSYGVGLHNADAIVIVYDQAGETVAFAVDKAVAVGESGFSDKTSRFDRLGGRRNRFSDRRDRLSDRRNRFSDRRNRLSDRRNWLGDRRDRLSGRRNRAGQSNGDTYPERPGDHILPKVWRKDILAGETQHTDGDRSYLIVPVSQKIPALREHTDDVTFSRLADNLGDGTREYPRMESQKRVLSTFL